MRSARFKDGLLLKEVKPSAIAGEDRGGGGCGLACDVRFLLWVGSACAYMIFESYPIRLFPAANGAPPSVDEIARFRAVGASAAGAAAEEDDDRATARDLKARAAEAAAIESAFTAAAGRATGGAGATAGDGEGGGVAAVDLAVGSRVRLTSGALVHLTGTVADVQPQAGTFTMRVRVSWGLTCVTSLPVHAHRLSHSFSCSPQLPDDMAAQLGCDSLEMHVS